MATEPNPPLPFPSDFAERVIRRGQLEQRRARRRVIYAAAVSLLLLVAAGIGFRHNPAPAPSLASSATSDGAARAWAHSPLFVSMRDDRELDRPRTEERRSPAEEIGLNESSAALFR